MTRGELQFCPSCRRRWPRGAEYDVRSFRWLDDLPRSVSPSNIDCIIHDGHAGRDRFLVLETKHAGDVIDKGQAWLLKALAGLAPERLGVRILAGTADQLSLHRVTRDRIDEAGEPTSPTAFRGAVARWLNGALWRDAESSAIVDRRPVVPACNHSNGWAKDGAGFYCPLCHIRWEAA